MTRAKLLKTPVTVVAVAAVVVTIVVTSALNIDISPFLTRIGSSIGTILVLVTLFKTEQTHYDLNNGVVVDKVKTALAETNVPGADQARTDTPSVPVDVATAVAVHPAIIEQIAAALTSIAATVPAVEQIAKATK